MLVSLSVSDRTQVVIGQFSLGATASGFGFKQPLLGEEALHDDHNNNGCGGDYCMTCSVQECVKDKKNYY